MGNPVAELNKRREGRGREEVGDADEGVRDALCGVKGC